MLKCSRCQELLPESDFRLSSHPRGRDYRCRSCYRKYLTEKKAAFEALKTANSYCRDCDAVAVLDAEGRCRKCVRAGGWKWCPGCGQKKLRLLEFWPERRLCMACTRAANKRLR